MKKFLMLWRLLGCVLLIMALSVGVHYRKLSKQEIQADANTDTSDLAGNLLETNTDESDLEKDYLETNTDESDLAEDLLDTDMDEYGSEENLPDADGLDSGYENNSSNGRYDGDIVIATEYDIEEYCKGCFIVSKNDGLLYGLLDVHGNEILPVSYDAIDFVNAKEVLNGEHETLYLEVKYEGNSQIFDGLGHQIFDRHANCIDYEFGNPDSESAFWNIWDNKRLQVYAEDKRLLCELDYSRQPLLREDSVSIRTMWACPDYFFTYVMGQKINGAAYIGTGAYLYNKNGETIRQWDEAMMTEYIYCEDDLKYFYIAYNDGVHEKYSLDGKGNVEFIQTMEMNEVQQEMAGKMYNEYFAESEDLNEGIFLGQDKNIKLYYSNQTYKLEDEKGNALYDERYYDCYRKDKCYVLVNEDNQACLVNRNGKLVIDYGWLEAGDNRVSFLGKELDTDDLLDSGEEVGIVVKEDGVNKVYLFSEKK